MNTQAGLTERRLQSLKTLAKRLGVSFKDWSLLHQALTHTSYANEAKNPGILHNERLEFLGDAVLELATSTYLYKNFPEMPEGEMTKSRAAIVCEVTLAKRARELDLGKYLLFGKGELATGGRERASILADAFESVIGAIYLDQGSEAAFAYVLERLQDDLCNVRDGQILKDYKTLLQEVVQKHADQTIHYELVAESGPDHSKVFEFAVKVNDVVCGIGQGRSKKEAEQHAAQQALEKRK